jgi:glycylpeptide N-tetradecanoyltransferase
LHDIKAYLAIFPPAFGSVPGGGIDVVWSKEQLGLDLTVLSIAMSQSTGAYIEEVVDSVENGQNNEGDSHGEDQEHPQASSSSVPAASGNKKKKKKKSKVSKMLQPGGEVPQQLVDHVVKEVQAKHGSATEGTDEASVRAVLEQLKIMDVIKGKSGLGGKNRKDMGEHKVSLFVCGIVL